MSEEKIFDEPGFDWDLVNLHLQEDHENLVRLARFCKQESHRYDFEFPFHSNGMLAATNGVAIVWIKSLVSMHPSADAPNLDAHFERIQKLKDWKPFTFTQTECNDSFHEEFSDQICENCVIEILGKRFNWQRVEDIASSFDVVEICLDGQNLAFWLENGFAYLVGLHRGD